jgi:hypothetical protein
MSTQGVVVQPGEGLVTLSRTVPGRFYALKLLGGATGDSIMLFEETMPPGTGARSTCTTTAMRSAMCWRARSRS